MSFVVISQAVSFSLDFSVLGCCSKDFIVIPTSEPDPAMNSRESCLVEDPCPGQFGANDLCRFVEVGFGFGPVCIFGLHLASAGKQPPFSVVE